MGGSRPRAPAGFSARSRRRAAGAWDSSRAARPARGKDRPAENPAPRAPSRATRLVKWPGSILRLRVALAAASPAAVRARPTRQTRRKMPPSAWDRQGSPPHRRRARRCTPAQELLPPSRRAAPSRDCPLAVRTQNKAGAVFCGPSSERSTRLSLRAAAACLSFRRRGSRRKTRHGSTWARRNQH